MSDPTVQPAPKKGLSTGIKILIGCLIGVLLVVGGCVVVTTYFLKKGVGKLQEMTEKYEKDPDALIYDTALLGLQASPEFEVVSSDADAKTITVRSKADGKEVTFNLDDIKAGRLSIESGGDTVNIGVTPVEGGEGAGMTIESSQGRAVFGASSGTAPEWIPSYPGARSDSFSTIEANGEKSGTFSIHTADNVEQVLAFYEERLKADGYEVQKTTMNVQGAESANLTATLEKRSINVTSEPPGRRDAGPGRLQREALNGDRLASGRPEPRGSGRLFRSCSVVNATVPSSAPPAAAWSASATSAA